MIAAIFWDQEMAGINQTIYEDNSIGLVDGRVVNAGYISQCCMG